MKEVLSVDGSVFDDMITHFSHVVVDCFAEWCGPCKVMGPIFEKVAQDKNLDNWVFAKMDVDNVLNVKVNETYEIASIPTLLIFKDGKIVKSLVGTMTVSDLTNTLNKIG